MPEQVRLLVCHNPCLTVEELPWYAGHPDNDDTLNYRVSFHRFPDGNEHFGSLHVVDKKLWDAPSVRAEIVARFPGHVGTAGSGGGLGQTHYDVKNNFQADAMECWEKHSRTHNCDEYMSEKKTLLPDTKAERKSERLSPKDRPKSKLCMFCPVASLVAQRKRSAAGLYNKQSWETD